ncbi:hypothetical protein D9758_013480 [Tetrapyrgos nigripes]|uniref:C3H1-type domain-containing protein n=1 Tax=Tetrapyrgos nigripes TaxID=182062 RepID=A0A8H5FRL9_9AGAR|nr:hypothetical protein D9758_013480 [Tetrapyrgos nigripes]
MPPLPSNVSNDYAARTPCKKHMMEYTGQATGSMRWSTYSDCEYRSLNYSCRYSHHIFNTKRILKLGNGIIRLNYGYGFERYGGYDDQKSGWDIKLDDKILCSDGQKTWDLPKSILFAELTQKITWKGAPEVQYEKKQSLCPDYQKGLCSRGSQCRFDHDLVDERRLQKLVRWPVDHIGTEGSYMTVECHNTGSSVRWKITLNPDAFEKLNKNDPIARTIPPRPFSREGSVLLDLIREMEKIVGIATSGDVPLSTARSLSLSSTSPMASVTSTNTHRSTSVSASNPKPTTVTIARAGNPGPNSQSSLTTRTTTLSPKTSVSFTSSPASKSSPMTRTSVPTGVPSINTAVTSSSSTSRPTPLSTTTRVVDPSNSDTFIRSQHILPIGSASSRVRLFCLTI